MKALEYEAFRELVKDCVVHLVVGQQSKLVRITGVAEGPAYLINRVHTGIYLQHVPSFEGRGISKLTAVSNTCFSHADFVAFEREALFNDAVQYEAEVLEEKTQQLLHIALKEEEERLGRLLKVAQERGPKREVKAVTDQITALKRNPAELLNHYQRANPGGSPPMAGMSGQPQYDPSGMQHRGPPGRVYNEPPRKSISGWVPASEASRHGPRRPESSPRAQYEVSLLMYLGAPINVPCCEDHEAPPQRQYQDRGPPRRDFHSPRGACIRPIVLSGL